MNPDYEVLVRRLVRLEQATGGPGRKSGQPERGWSPHFLTTPYTNASFNGDAFSTVGANTLIDNASWSTTIPTNAKALVIRAKVRDSGSARGTGHHFSLYPAAAAATAAMEVDVCGMPDDEWTNRHATVPCTDGDIWYQCNTFGAGTMDVWLWVFGWWE